MKKPEYMDINGRTFEVIHTPYPRKPTREWYRLEGYELSDVYANPSAAKQKAFDDWDLWAYESRAWFSHTPYEIHGFGISSHSCQAFSLRFIVCEKATGDIIGMAWVTTRHNRLYLFD